MTEAEAAIKWCPQRRPESSMDGNYFPACLGSRCMMWEWFEGETAMTATMANEAKDIPAPEGDGWVREGEPGQHYQQGAFHMRQVWRRPNPARQGDCGLKGHLSQVEVVQG